MYKEGVQWQRYQDRFSSTISMNQLIEQQTWQDVFVAILLDVLGKCTDGGRKALGLHVRLRLSFERLRLNTLPKSTIP